MRKAASLKTELAEMIEERDQAIKVASFIDED